MTSITFFLIFIPILSFILLGFNFLLAPHNPYKEKKTPFECGYHSFLSQNRTQFTISFFIFGLLFLIFDLEIVLIYPYSVSSYANNIYGLIVMIIFTLIVTVGFIFELGKNALKIESRQSKKLEGKLYRSKANNVVNFKKVNSNTSLPLHSSFSFNVFKSSLMQHFTVRFLAYLEDYLRRIIENIIPDKLKNFSETFFNVGSIDDLNLLVLDLYLVLINNKLHVMNSLAGLAVLSAIFPPDYSVVFGEIFQFAIAFIFLITAYVAYLLNSERFSAKYPLMDLFIKVCFFLLLALSILYISASLENLISALIEFFISYVLKMTSLGYGKIYNDSASGFPEAGSYSNDGGDKGPNKGPGDNKKSAHYTEEYSDRDLTDEDSDGSIFEQNDSYSSDNSIAESQSINNSDMDNSEFSDRDDLELNEIIPFSNPEFNEDSIGDNDSSVLSEIDDAELNGLMPSSLREEAERELAQYRRIIALNHYRKKKNVLPQLDIPSLSVNAKSIRSSENKKYREKDPVKTNWYKRSGMFQKSNLPKVAKKAYYRAIRRKTKDKLNSLPEEQRIAKKEQSLLQRRKHYAENKSSISARRKKALTDFKKKDLEWYHGERDIINDKSRANFAKKKSLESTVERDTRLESERNRINAARARIRATETLEDRQLRRAKKTQENEKYKKSHEKK